MPIFKINREDFQHINWPAVEQHLSDVYEELKTNISLFIGVAGTWEYSIALAGKDIVCQFWKKPVYRPKRPILDNPKRAGYLLRSERNYIDVFIKSAGLAPWINLKPVYQKSPRGIVTVHFKIHDYEPFWKN